MQDIFDAKVAQDYINRINQLSPESQALWGKMTVDQMLRHCNKTYESVYEMKSTNNVGWMVKWILKVFVKPMVVSEKPYKHNLQTVPSFKVAEKQDFELEKKRLIAFIQKTQTLGEEAFDGKIHFGFGKLSAQDWNTLFAKHLNHHLQQFGV